MKSLSTHQVVDRERSVVRLIFTGARNLENPGIPDSRFRGLPIFTSMRNSESAECSRAVKM